MISIIADSTVDLGSDLVQKHHVQILPLYVQHQGKTYLDGIDIDNQRLFRLVEQNHELPKTSAASVADFVKVFSSVDAAICLTISSKLFSTYANACIAKDNLGNDQIRVIDSLNVSTGTGLLVMEAAKLRDQGCTVSEIEKSLCEKRMKIHTSLILENLDYIRMSGRCSAIQSFASSLLKIRPVLEVRRDGTLGVRAKTRGHRKQALDYLVEELRQNGAKLDRSHIFITHTDCPEDAEYLREAIQEIAAPGEILITLAGSVVASHCGQKTIGILYFLR